MLFTNVGRICRLYYPTSEAVDPFVNLPPLVTSSNISSPPIYISLGGCIGFCLYHDSSKKNLYNYSLNQARRQPQPTEGALANEGGAPLPPPFPPFLSPLPSPSLPSPLLRSRPPEIQLGGLGSAVCKMYCLPYQSYSCAICPLRSRVPTTRPLRSATMLAKTARLTTRAARRK